MYLRAARQYLFKKCLSNHSTFSLPFKYKQTIKVNCNVIQHSKKNVPRKNLNVKDKIKLTINNLSLGYQSRWLGIVHLHSYEWNNNEE